MTIGFISQALPYLPARDGFRIYAGNLLRALSRRHKVHLVSLLEEGDEQHLDWAREHCASLAVIRVGKLNAFQRLANLGSSYCLGTHLHCRSRLGNLVRSGMRSSNWDVLHVEGFFTAGLIDPKLPIAKVLSVHDCQTLRCTEMLSCAEGLRERLALRLLRHHERRYERMIHRRFGRSVFVTERDAQSISSIVPGCRVAVVPNGTDSSYFYPVPVEKIEDSIVFHGHLGYAPNVHAALEFPNRILPIIRRKMPQATFHIVGAEPDQRIRALTAQPGIQLSANLGDLRAAVCSARIYVCPIRYGTGVKNKLLEAMSMQLPIVCYPEAIAGINCTPGKHLLVARTATEFADAVLNLLQNPEFAERIARAGRALVREEYTWEARARAFEDLYEQVIQERYRGYVSNPPSRRLSTNNSCGGEAAAVSVGPEQITE
jgi:glycosyltransferase involved in cell wall biosynthesis